MSQKFTFKLSSTSTTTYPDPEALFRDLKNRDPNIQHLWSHQADIVREYHKNRNKLDVALELPTGAGKTLVGLLIAEWRRLTLKQRVAYLCPTRQLAHQVGQKASQYGINAHVLVGPQNQYPAGEFSDYASGDAIAITTYSGLFNTSPKIDRPETIVLDDAHAGENYIASMWSLTILRSKYKAIFDQVVDLYTAELPQHLSSSLKDDNVSPYQKYEVELLSQPKFMRKAQALIDLLDATTNNTDLRYSWQLLRNNLGGCCAFFLGQRF